MNEEIEQMRGIRELLIKALVVATGASEEAIREAPLTEAIKFRKTLGDVAFSYLREALRPVSPSYRAPTARLQGRDEFEEFVKRAGFTDWSRYGDGYAKPSIDRMWTAWSLAPLAQPVIESNPPSFDGTTYGDPEQPTPIKRKETK